MPLEINARHFTLGTEQREIISTNLQKLLKFSPRQVISLQLNIDYDAGRFTADSVLRLKSHDFRAGATGPEPEIVAGEVIENLRRQLAKFKGKISGKQQGDEGGLGATIPVEAFDDVPAPSTPGALILKEMDVDLATISFENSEKPFLVFRNTATQSVAVIYRQADGTAAHMESSSQ